MAKILCIETATEICSVAITDTIYGFQHACEINEPYSHSSQLNVLIQKVLLKCNLSIKKIKAIAVSGGPGSYTGLRVGCSSAKGLCYALDIPYIHLDTLAILANQIEDNNTSTIIPMIDARRMEVYMGVYRSNLSLIEEINAFIIDEDSMKKLLRKYPNPLFIGNGAKKVVPFIPNPDLFIDTGLHSKDMCSLAVEKYLGQKFEDLAYYEPNYLKSPNITISKKSIL